jgi:putative transposase
VCTAKYSLKGFPAMALSESAVSELLEVLRTGDAVDLIRESVRMVLQELIETEASDVIGAARYERTDSRVNERNGSRPRILATQAGDIDLRIPKLRKGSFFPLILEPRRRIDQALYAVVMEAYAAGVSTRAVDDLVAALGIDSGISKSEVSRICAGLDEVVTAFRTRRLDHTTFPRPVAGFRGRGYARGGRTRAGPTGRAPVAAARPAAPTGW